MINLFCSGRRPFQADAMSPGGASQQISKTANDASRLVSRVFACTQPSELQKRSNKQCLEKCLTEIARMYRVAPTARPLLEELRERISVAKTWVEFGFDVSVLEADYESVRFLVKERVLFSIVGLANTSEAGKDQLHIEDGRISVLCEGAFVPVRSLLDRFHYVKEDLQYREKGTNLPWNYLLPNGFVQIDRCETPELAPTTLLSPEEMTQLLTHAQQFEGSSFSERDPPVGVLQIITNPRKRIRKDSFLFDGFESLFPVHVGIRFIDAQGRVFSTGFASTMEEDRYCTGRGNILASINGVPGITDYEEFRPHEGRRVTSIPLSSEACEKVMGEMQKMRTQGVRFNILTQNCARMATHMLEVAGIKVEHEETPYQCLFYLLPSLASFPRVQRLVEKVLNISQWLSEKTHLPSLGENISLAVKITTVVLTPVRAIMNVAINLLLMAFGAHKGSPLKNNMYGESPRDGMRRFFAIVSSVRDLIKAPVVYHSGPVIAWQDLQKTTCHYTYTRPSMNILPSGGLKVPDAKKLPYKRFVLWHDRCGRISTLAPMRRRIAVRRLTHLRV